MCAAPAVGAALVVAAGAAGAQTLRCPGGVVGRGDTTEAVQARCGDPVHRSVHQRRLRASPVFGRDAVRLVDIETWTYHRGYGRFILYLTFEGGRLTRIDRGPRQE